MNNLIPELENQIPATIDDLKDFLLSEYDNTTTTARAIEDAQKQMVYYCTEIWNPEVESAVAQLGYQVFSLPAQYGFPSLSNYLNISQGISSENNKHRNALAPTKLLELGCYMSNVIRRSLGGKRDLVIELMAKQDYDIDLERIKWGFVPPKNGAVNFSINDIDRILDKRSKYGLPLRLISLPVITAFNSMHLEPTDFDTYSVEDLLKIFDKNVNSPLEWNIDIDKLSYVSRMLPKY